MFAGKLKNYDGWIFPFITHRKVSQKYKQRRNYLLFFSSYFSFIFILDIMWYRRNNRGLLTCWTNPTIHHSRSTMHKFVAETRTCVPISVTKSAFWNILRHHFATCVALYLYEQIKNAVDHCKSLIINYRDMLLITLSRSSRWGG